MVRAVACANVPKLTVVVGGTFGAGNYGMSDFLPFDIYSVYHSLLIFDFVCRNVGEGGKSSYHERGCSYKLMTVECWIST